MLLSAGHLSVQCCMWDMSTCFVLQGVYHEVHDMNFIRMQQPRPQIFLQELLLCVLCIWVLCCGMQKQCVTIK